jgi:dienelactone hydrolase
MLSVAEASSVSIPMVLLASGDEPAEDVAGFETALQAAGVKNHVETFGDMIHGWMAARADLEDPNVVKEYERGYKIVLDFFLQNV